MGFEGAKAASVSLRSLEARLAALETQRNLQATLSLTDLIYASEAGVGADHVRAPLIARALAKVKAAGNDPLAREICRLDDGSSQAADCTAQSADEKKRGQDLSGAPAIIRRWRDDPVLFARQAIGVAVDSWQGAVLTALAVDARVAQMAGRGPGKTFVLAIAILWYLVTRAHAKIVAVSLSSDNLRRGLVAELASMLRRATARSALFERFDMTGDGLALSEARLDWFVAFRSWSRDADANTQAAALGGIHGDSVLFCMDEAGGIAPEVLQVAEAVAANANPAVGREAKLLLAGNPLSRTSALYRACISNRDRWRVFEVSSAPDDPLRAPRVDPAWAQTQIDQYGADSAFVQISVFGRFPATAINALLSESEVIGAQRRDVPLSAYRDAARVVGLDPARFGSDASVLTLRQGRKVLLMQTFRNIDNMMLADIVGGFINEQRPDAVFIDSGNGGGVIDRLRSLGFDVREVHFAGKPASSRYLNKRVEMYARMAEWVRDGGCLTNQPELVADLSEPQYSFAGDKMQLESKDGIRARIGRSPDWGDSLALTFTEDVMPAWLPSRWWSLGQFGPPSRHQNGTSYDPIVRGLGPPPGDRGGYG